MSSSPAANPAKTMTMSRAAEVMMRPERCSPRATALVGRRGPPFVELDDAGEEEDLVVHGEPEPERQHQQRDGVLDTAHGVESEHVFQVPFLEDPHDDPKVAPSESTFMTRALIGITTEPVMRKSRTKVASTTSATAYGAPSVTLSWKSLIPEA
jgi:hypothetical protein